MAQSFAGWTSLPRVFAHLLRPIAIVGDCYLRERVAVDNNSEKIYFMIREEILNVKIYEMRRVFHSDDESCPIERINPSVMSMAKLLHYFSPRQRQQPATMPGDRTIAV